MKTIILSYILLGVMALGFAEEERHKEHLIAVYVSKGDIDGTVLSQWNSIYTDSKDESKSYGCAIGYTQDIGDQSTFVSVLELPKNDERYFVACKNGVLTVTAGKDKAMVATLNLNNLAPSLITKRLAEQAGAGQPATAPKLKPEGNPNPEPESEARPR